MAERHYSNILNYALPAVLMISITTAVFATENSASLNTDNKLLRTSVIFDINNDGEKEIGDIKSGSAEIYNQNYPLSTKKTLFKSDPSWDVKEILNGDFNNDGQMDFALSLWKEGSFGPSKPLWDKGELDDSYKMHLFVYTWKNGKISPLWHSSNLPKENILTRLKDLDKDGKNELIVIEKSYDPINPEYTVGIWSWNIWGFELKKRFHLLNPFKDLTE